MTNDTVTPSRKKSQKEILYDKRKKMMETVAWRTAYYRANPHRFAKDYLGIHLKLFQCILLCFFNSSNYSMVVAARGIGKSFIAAVFCVIRCILYPSTKICVVSGTRKQANQVLLKVQDELMPHSALLRNEIEYCNIGSNDAVIRFKNNSWIRVVTATDSGRGNRANILIVDEFVKVNENIIAMVLKKFLTSEREPEFLHKPEFKDFPRERNKEVYMSSAWMKSHWSYDKLKSYTAQLMDDKKSYFCCGLPYQLSIKENLLSRAQCEDEMSEADFNETIWEIEMGCIWFGDKDGAFFGYDDVVKQRNMKQAIYPPNEIYGNYSNIPDLLPNERRIIGVDVALLASTKHNNDAASIWIDSAIPNSNNKYVGNFYYTENHEGLLTSELALLVRRMYEQFHCTDIALDVKGLGIGIYDALIEDISDPQYGIIYPALNCCNDSTYADRCHYPKAPKVIWAIQGSEAFNSNMYLSLRDGFKQGKINLLINELDAEDVIRTFKGYSKMSSGERIDLQLPYLHTTLLINELINLKYLARGTSVKVYERAGARKDRVSSVGYCYYVQCEIERKKRERRNEHLTSEQIAMTIKRPVLRKL